MSRARAVSSKAGVMGQEIASTPLAIIDFETTGLSPGRDRVVEVSVVRAEAGGRKRELVFDSLINPRRRVSAAEIHGITDAMVKDAPGFGDVWPALRSALAGCVLVAYNAYFDMRFLEAEAEMAGDTAAAPFFCMMHVRSLIGVGQRCGLEAACREHGVKLRDAHRSARDAMATAELVPPYLASMRANGVRTFQDLSDTGSHQYLQSFSRAPLRPARTGVSAAAFPRERVQVRRGGIMGFLSRG